MVLGIGGAAAGQKEGGRGGVFLRQQQGGQHPHNVVGGPIGGKKSGDGDLQAVPVKQLWVGGLVQNGLGDPLAEGALAKSDPSTVVPHGGGKQLGGAGRAGVQQDQKRLVSQVRGGTGGGIKGVAVASIPEAGYHGSSADK